MKYINKVTGAVIEAACEISGGDWEPVPQERPEAQEKARGAKTKKQKE